MRTQGHTTTSALNNKRTQPQAHMSAHTSAHTRSASSPLRSLTSSLRTSFTLRFLALGSTKICRLSKLSLWFFCCLFSGAPRCGKPQAFAERSWDEKKNRIGSAVAPCGPPWPSMRGIPLASALAPIRSTRTFYPEKGVSAKGHDGKIQRLPGRETPLVCVFLQGNFFFIPSQPQTCPALSRELILTPRRPNFALFLVSDCFIFSRP